MVAPHCQSSPNIKHSMKSTDATYVNTVVKYACDSGYQLEGRPIGEYEQFITCEIGNYDGVPYWKGNSNLSDCIPINCESPSSFPLTKIENITITLPEENVTYTGGSTYFLLSEVIYSCNSGHIFSHTGEVNASIRCKTVPENTHAATWEPLHLACIRM